MTKSVFQSLILLASFCILAPTQAQEEAIAEAAPAESTKPTAPIASSAVAKADEASSQPKARPITVAVSLVDDSTIITGTLTETTSLSIKTAFGLAELPLNEVAGVRFPRGDDTSTTVVMLNGDSITGATDLKFAQVETTWGSAKINGQNIASMMMVPGLAWQSTDVLGSKRWQLIEGPRNAQGGASSGVMPGGATNRPSGPSTGASSTLTPRAGSGTSPGTGTGSSSTLPSPR
jgi:hypothetical protein